MNIPKVIVNGDKYELLGNFEFEAIPSVIITEDLLRTYKVVTFKFDPEVPQDLNLRDIDDQCNLIELYGERLKQDFIKFIFKKVTETR